MKKDFERPRGDSPGVRDEERRATARVPQAPAPPAPLQSRWDCAGCGTVPAPPAPEETRFTDENDHPVYDYTNVIAAKNAEIAALKATLEDARDTIEKETRRVNTFCDERNKAEAMLEEARAAMLREGIRTGEIEAERDAAIRALESLTPGGSEFVGDPAACAAFVRDRREREHVVIIELTKKRRAAEADNARLRELLVRALPWLGSQADKLCDEIDAALAEEGK